MRWGELLWIGCPHFLAFLFIFGWLANAVGNFIIAYLLQFFDELLLFLYFLHYMIQIYGITGSSWASRSELFWIKLAFVVSGSMTSDILVDGGIFVFFSWLTLVCFIIHIIGSGILYFVLASFLVASLDWRNKTIEFILLFFVGIEVGWRRKVGLLLIVFPLIRCSFLVGDSRGGPGLFDWGIIESGVLFGIKIHVLCV